jgi:hypothetical protein
MRIGIERLCWLQNVVLYWPAMFKPMAYCTKRRGHRGPHSWERQ